MKLIRLLVLHLLLGLMVLVPFYHLFESDVEASPSIPAGYRPSLLLSSVPLQPSYDRLQLLDRAVIAHYTVGPHDSLWGLHERFKVDEDTLRSSNSEDATSLSGGRVLLIPNHRGTLYEVKAGETLSDITKKFAWGRRDPVSFTATVLAMNGYPAPEFKTGTYSFPAGTFLFLPNTTIKYWAVDIPVEFAGRLRISSGFGSRFHPVLHVRRRHDGWDLPRPFGSPVRAAQSGSVTFAGWSEGYGNLIIVTLPRAIKGFNGYNVKTIRYGHLSKMLVTEGQHVRQGQLIGRVGSTGISTGPHLHFELRDASGRPVNPRNFTH